MEELAETQPRRHFIVSLCRLNTQLADMEFYLTGKADVGRDYLTGKADFGYKR